MSKKLVAGLIGWLFLALILSSSVWAAANKDKTPKRMQTTAQTGLNPYSKADYFRSIIKSQMGGWVTKEEIQRQKREDLASEFAPVSAWDAATASMWKPEFFQTGVLAETVSVIFDTSGSTFFDIAGHGSEPREIVLTGGWKSISNNKNAGTAWTDLPVPVTVGTGTTSRNVVAKIYKGDKKGITDTLIRVASTPGDRAGYSGIANTPLTDRLVMFYHHANAPAGSFFVAEKSAGAFDWDNEINIPDSAGVPNSTQSFWPMGVGGMLRDVNDYNANANTNDTIEVLHFIMWDQATGAHSPFVYARAVDSGGVGTAAWIWPGFCPCPGSQQNSNKGLIVDSGGWFEYQVVASKQSPKVALIWGTEKDCNPDIKGLCTDLFYLESTNGGQEWIDAGSFSSFTPVPITYLDSNATTRPNGDIAGLYDDKDSLVITWVQYTDFDPSTGDRTYTSDIYTWRANYGARKSITGRFPIATTVRKIPNQYRVSLNEPHIALHDGTGNISRKGYLYMTYTQYAGFDAASLADTTVQGLYNGEVYISCSTNHGKTWSQGINITKSKLPATPKPTNNNGIGAGACWASSAERCNDTIHVFFLSDEYSGSLQFGDNTTGTSGTATYNEAIYMKYPAFVPVATRQISANPSTITENPSSAKTDTLRVQNIGNANLTVDSVRHKTSATWLAINNGSGGFTIIEGDPDYPVGFTVNDASPTPLTDGIYYDTFTIYNNSANLPVLKVPVFLIVDHIDPFFFTVQRDTMNNGRVQVEVSNVSNTGRGRGFYRIINPEASANRDTTENLFDASKFIAFKSRVNQDSTVFRYIFNENNMAPMDTNHCTDTTLNAALPAKPGSPVSIPAGKYKYCRVFYTGFYPGLDGIDWPGEWPGIKVKEEWWLPDSLQTDTAKAWDPKFLLWEQTLYLKKVHRPTWWGVTDVRAFDSTTTSLYIGKAMDWDVFSQAGSDNYGRANKRVGVTWQIGTDTTDTINHQIPNGHYGFAAFLDNHGAYAAHIVDNNAYIYPQAGYNDKQLYRIAADAPQDPSNQDSLYTKRKGQGYRYIPSDTGTGADTLPQDLNSVLVDTVIVPPYPDSITLFNVLGVIGDTAHGDSVKAMQAADRNCDSLANALKRMRAHLGLAAYSFAANLADTLHCKLSACDAKAGDVNASGGTPNLQDVIYLVNFVFDKSRVSPPCNGTDPGTCWPITPICRGDVNGSGGTPNLQDVIYLVNFVFDKSRVSPPCNGTDPGTCWPPISTLSCCL